MADERESASLGKVVKSQTKYGATTKSIHTSDKFMKYPLERGDTLQGIALKHGVSMEMIKRANHLWTNDSLYLRDFLLIPIPKATCNVDSLILMNGADNGENGLGAGSKTEQQYEIITRQDLVRQSKNVPRSKSCMDSFSATCDKSSKDSGDNDTSAKDFLSKFDFNIAKIKRNMEELDATSNFPEDNTNPLNLLPRRRSAFTRRHRTPPSTDDEFTLDFNVPPDLVFVSGDGVSSRTVSSNRLRTSLERLQKRDEDLFQL